eukprot:1159081-Pelagomonas_calceolata.AAC.12
MCRISLGGALACPVNVILVLALRLSVLCVCESVGMCGYACARARSRLARNQIYVHSLVLVSHGRAHARDTYTRLDAFHGGIANRGGMPTAGQPRSASCVLFSRARAIWPSW